MSLPVLNADRSKANTTTVNISPPILTRRKLKNPHVRHGQPLTGPSLRNHHVPQVRDQSAQYAYRYGEEADEVVGLGQRDLGWRRRMVTAPRIVFASIRLLKCSRSSCFLLGACLALGLGFGVCIGVFVFGVGEMHIYDFDLRACAVLYISQ
jgi:hypothetical protein